MSGAIDEEDIAILGIPVSDDAARQWSIAEHAGAIFSEDESADYSGWALVIEVRSEAEARMMADTLVECLGPGLVGWQPGPEDAEHGHGAVMQ